MPFDPLKAVHIHTHGDRTIALNTIGCAEEENLLIHACGFSADRQIKIREHSPDGELIFRADADPVLVWRVRATVLAWSGLANAHPGPLARQALVFANGGRIPHQFLPFRAQYEGEEPGILFYESPSTDVEGGDTAEISFNVALEFSDLDTENHAGHESLTPGGWTFTVPAYVPGAPGNSEWLELPAQTSANLTEAGINAVLSDAFCGTDSFSSAPLTATLYNGDPLDGGTPVSDAVDLPLWTSVESLSEEQARIRNHAAVEWVATGALRVITHIAFTRNGIVSSVKTLASAITLPAYRGLRAPVDALAIQCIWPRAGSSLSTPAGLALQHLFGDATALLFPAETDLTIKLWTWDAFDGGVLLDSFFVPRNVSYWTAAAGSVTNAEDLIGVITAPVPDGWASEYCTVELDGLAMPLFANYRSLAAAAVDPFVVVEGAVEQQLL